MKSPVLCLALFLTLLPATPVAAKDKPKVQEFTFKFANKTRTVYAVIPAKEEPMPLVVLLHGSGRDGEIMASQWKDLAVREGFMVAAPDAAISAMWDPKGDPPEFFYSVVSQIAVRHAVDLSRVYLFGHSGGAAYALFLSIVSSNFFAATAIHAGSLPADPKGLFRPAQRKTPIAIWVGDRDAFFPMDVVRATRDLLQSHGYDVQLNVVVGHDHNYYEISPEIDAKAWNFLKDKHLPAPGPAATPAPAQTNP